MATITLNQARSLIFNVVGRATETQSTSFLQLVVSINNSGYSIGALQTDFGQFPSTGRDLLVRYQTWASPDVQLNQDQLRLANAVIVKQGLGFSGERLDSNVANKLNSFLESSEGRSWVTQQDEARFTEKYSRLIEPITQSSVFQGMQQDQATILLARIAKAFNQNNILGDKLKQQFLAGEMDNDNFDSVLQATMIEQNAEARLRTPPRGFVSISAIDKGQNSLVDGGSTDLYLRLQNDQGAWGERWRSLQSRDPGFLNGNSSDPDARLFDVLFRDPIRGTQILNKVDAISSSNQPQLLVLTRSSGAALVAVDKFGNLYVQDGVSGHRLIKGETDWRPYQSNIPEGQSFSPGIRRTNGKWVVALGDTDIELSDQTVAVVNINGTDVTLDANSGNDYAFNVSGDLLEYQASNGYNASYKLLTGANKDDTFAVSVNTEQSSAMWNITLGGLALGFAPPDLNELAYNITQTSASTGITTLHVITPIREDGNVVGQRQVVSRTLGNQELDTTTTTSRTGDLGQSTATIDIKKYGANNGIISHTSSTTNRDGTGQIVGSVDITFNAIGGVAQTVTMARNPNGTTTLTTRDGLGNIKKTVDNQIFDDGSAFATTTYPNGRTEVLATDAFGAPFSRTDTIPGSSDAVVINTYRYTTAGQPVIATSRRVENFFDSEGEYRNETVTTYANGVATVQLVRYGYDGQEYARESLPAPNTALSNLTNEQTSAIFSDVSGLIGAIRSGQRLPIAVSGIRILNTLDGLDGVQDIPNLGAAAQVGAGVLSFYNLYNAFQSGSDFARLNATLSSINYANIAINGTVTAANSTAGSVNTFLNGGSGTVGVLPALGLISSIKAGDPIGIAQSIGTLLNPGFLTTPLGIFLIGASILQAIFTKPPKAWGVASVTYGEGFDNLKLQVNASGELFGKDRVRDQLSSLIDKTITLPNDPSYGTQAGQTIRVGLQAQIDQINASLPADQRIGLVAQRMPGLAWRASDLNDSGYSLTDIDPLTGAQRYPFRRFDDNGLPFSSNPALYQVDLTDPQQRIKLDQALLQSAYSRQAIAPLWEVRTAKLQGDAGAVDAGLSEEERASKAGYAAKLDTAYAAANPNSVEAKQKRVGHFMPVALDLDGDGRISTSTIAQQNASTTDAIEAVSFNWDGSPGSDGFKKQTSWVNANDGFLVLDRDFNQSVDNGGELLSNPLVADPAKGMRSLATWDANGDGRIDANDPIYKQLKVWQDFNQDGDNTQTAIFNTAAGIQEFTVQDEATITNTDANGQATSSTVQELRSLESLGITAIDYSNGRYEFNSTLRNNHNGYTPISALNAPHNGQGTSYGSIQTITLDANNDGVRYTPAGAGIKIDDSSGDSTILITQIQSEQAVFDSLNALNVQGETIGSANARLYEDGVPMAWNPGNPNTYLHTTESIALCAGSMTVGGRKSIKSKLFNSCTL